MKKVIVGTGLFICGTLVFLTALLRKAIYYTYYGTISDETFLSFIGGVFFIVGIVICIISLFENTHFESNHDEKEQDMLPQITCPKCGKQYDMDYPKCPFCKYDYHSK